jgi:predicted DNA-binding transcriptional regulator AlpA
MPVQKPEPASQFDLFSARSEPTPRPTTTLDSPTPANDTPAEPLRSKTIPATNPLPPAADEWWTTRMTCAFLKISRKTLWERRKDKSLGFPRPVQLGGARNLYRASAIRNWAEAMAQEEG